MLGPVRPLFQTFVQVARDLVALIVSAMRSRAHLAAENLFLRKQLALYLERQVKPHRADEATRITLVALSPFVDWRQSADRCETGDSHSVASKGIPVVVALQIAGTRPATDSGGSTAVDRHDGGRESDLGRGTDCRRTPGQARHPSVSADRAPVHALATTAPETGNPGRCAPSCETTHGRSSPVTSLSS
jgi:hypothetical protein